MRAVGVRELKDKLSRYLDEVKHGEVILVTDRGVVVAELRQPSAQGAGAFDPLGQRLRPLEAAGQVSAALPNDPGLYPPSPVLMAAGDVDRLLAESRDER